VFSASLLFAMIFPEKFPENLKFDNSKEKYFYHRFFKELPEDWDIFYSFKFINPGLPVRELDYIIVCPLGVFIVELKNAKFKIQDGKWLIYHSRERAWKEHKKNQYSGPVEQVSTAIEMFKEFLQHNNHLIPPASPSSIIGAIFLNKNESSQIQKFIYGAEFLIFHRELEQNSLYDILITIHERFKNEMVSKLEREKIKQIILINGNYYPGFQVRRNIQQRVIYALTLEQLKIVEGINEEPRLIIAGVVGSGKTLMAYHSIEVALENNWNILFLCSSEQLGSYIHKSFLENPLLEVTTFYNLIFGDYSSKTYDIIIVDEAQNIISSDMIDLFDKILIKGIHNGRWIIFMDQDQSRTNTKSEFLEKISSLPHKDYHLNTNIRNPNEILSLAMAIGGKKSGNTKIPDALNVKFVKYSNSIEARYKLYDIVEYGIKQLRLLPEEIVILSPHSYENTVEVQNLNPLKSGTNNPDIYEIALWEENKDLTGKIIFSTISHYQGLETSFVILTGITSLTDEILRSEYYIALTRSNYSAGILYSEDISEEMQKIFKFI
jgi:hypothetical protein